MAPLKYAIKCGNFAVLVDLHVLPLGEEDREDPSWFSADQVEEVTALVRESVDQRVKQYTESHQNKRLPKHKKELPPASAFYVKGKSFSLAANFLKRHSNLRCISKQLYGDLRVFPERYVVCVSCPKDASAFPGNLSLAAKELSEQSRSEYFSKVAEIQEPLQSSTKTKKSGLQKIAKQASVQKERGQQKDPRNTKAQSGLKSAQSDHITTSPATQIGNNNGNNLDPVLSCDRNSENTDRQTNLKEPSQASCQHKTRPETSKTNRDAGEDPHPKWTKRPRIQKVVANHIENNLDMTCDRNNGNSVIQTIEPTEASCQPKTSKTKRDARDDPHPQRAKRVCLKSDPAQQPSISTQTARHDNSLPVGEFKTESRAFSVSEHNKTTLEVELLTPGKRAQRLPLASNNTTQTNQNRLAASLRGLSVKPASSNSSISSRSALTHTVEGSENVPRASRLRRMKRS